MFKFNDKDTRETPTASFWCLYFTPSSSASTVKFEHGQLGAF